MAEGSSRPADDFSATTINPTLKKKVQKLVESDASDEDLVASLRDLFVPSDIFCPARYRLRYSRSSFYTKNTLSARWHLRDGLEKRALSSADAVLAEFGAIDNVRNL